MRHNPRPCAGGLSRRDVIRSAALIAVGAATLPPRRVRAGAAPARARNVIFMVSDGMSAGAFTLADTVRLRENGRRAHWTQLLGRTGARRSLTSTHSANSLVTDSAAAGSAWATGLKHPSGSLNVIGGATPEPILITAQKAGRSIGVVTTTRVTHATPASFLVNVADRGQHEPIARQMIERRADVILGGGAAHFPAALLAEAPDAVVVRSSAELRAVGARSGRLIGLFNDDHLSYVLDRDAEEPSLPAMARVALDRLDRNPDGFVLQIEAGRVDHAAHNNDAAALIADQLEFDDAVGDVLRWIGDRDDTLLIVTTDHGNANPGLTASGAAAERGLDAVRAARRSFDWIAREASLPADLMAGRGDAGLAGDLVDRTVSAVRDASGVDLPADERDLLASFLRGARVSPFRGLHSFSGVLGGILANHYGIGFMSGGHTSDHVETTAIGPGSESLAPVTDNTDMHRLMLAALGVAV